MLRDINLSRNIKAYTTTIPLAPPDCNGYERCPRGLERPRASLRWLNVCDKKTLLYAKHAPSPRRLFKVLLNATQTAPDKTPVQWNHSGWIHVISFGSALTAWINFERLPRRRQVLFPTQAYLKLLEGKNWAQGLNDHARLDKLECRMYIRCRPWYRAPPAEQYWGDRVQTVYKVRPEMHHSTHLILLPMCKSSIFSLGNLAKNL